MVELNDQQAETIFFFQVVFGDYLETNDNSFLRAAIRNFHLGPCKIEQSKIAKLCHNKGLPKPFLKI